VFTFLTIHCFCFFCAWRIRAFIHTHTTKYRKHSWWINHDLTINSTFFNSINTVLTSNFQNRSTRFIIITSSNTSVHYRALEGTFHKSVFTWSSHTFSLLSQLWMKDRATRFAQSQRERSGASLNPSSTAGPYFHVGNCSSRARRIFSSRDGMGSSDSCVAGAVGDVRSLRKGFR